LLVNVYTGSMKYLGIDYGTKKIGIAVSDDRGALAFPKTIIPNDNMALAGIGEIIKNEGIEKIIIGESVQMDGSHNDLQKNIEKFSSALVSETGLEVDMEKEWLSSVAARSHLYGKGNIANEQWSASANKKRREAVDAGAAAIILQRYLDRQGT